LVTNEKSRGEGELQNQVRFAYFFVESFCIKNGAKASHVPVGSADVEHVIRIENGSPISSFDVEVTTTLPNLHANTSGVTRTIEFDHGGKRAVTWRARSHQLPPQRRQDDRAVIIALTQQRCLVRADSSDLRYRSDPKHQWDKDPADPRLEIDIEIR
jgi:hypothetical protein